MNSRNTVTVLMPAYNAEATIKESIASLVSQTYRDWELLVLDDGSTDQTSEICSALAREDPRIQLVQLEHQGLVKVLNYGLRMAETQLIGRLDADDISYPTRLEKQIKFLAANPDVKVLGTWGLRINNAGQTLSNLRIGPTDINDYWGHRKRKESIFLIHSSIVADRETLLRFGGYNSDDYPLDDCWLWTKIAQQHLVLALPENLVGYRIGRQGGVSNSNYFLQNKQKARLQYSLEQERWIGVADFQAICKQHMLRRLILYRDYLHRYWFRKGAGYFFNGRQATGLLYFALSTAVNPIGALVRVRNRA